MWIKHIHDWRNWSSCVFWLKQKKDHAHFDQGKYHEKNELLDDGQGRCFIKAGYVNGTHHVDGWLGLWLWNEIGVRCVSLPCSLRSTRRMNGEAREGEDVMPRTRPPRPLFVAVLYTTAAGWCTTISHGPILTSRSHKYVLLRPILAQKFDPLNFNCFFQSSFKSSFKSSSCSFFLSF